MKVCFIYAEKDGDEEARESVLGNAFLAGVANEGDEIDLVTKSSAQSDPPDAEVVCMVGVKSLKLFRQMQALGKQIIYFDKGYLRHRGATRTWEYWRVAVNDHHPTSYVARAKHSAARWDTIAKRRLMKPAYWRTTGNHIIYAGSSEKYHAFASLPDPTEYANRVIEKIRRMSTRKIVYRPKPTWLEAVQIKGTEFSHRGTSIEDALRGAWCLVTNGSNASYDAIMLGIPCIVLGNAIARPLSSETLKEVENPPIPSNEDRDQWLWNLAWCQFTEAEMRAGIAWKCIKPQLEGSVLDDTSIDEAVLLGQRPTKGMMKRAGVWKKGADRPKRTKAEQRRTKPFLKGRNKAKI